MAGAKNHWMRWTSLGLFSILMGTIWLNWKAPPGFQGRSAHAWLKDLTLPNQNSREQARNAFSRMDSSLALPALRDALAKRDPWWEGQIERIGNKLQWVDFRFIKADAWRTAAVEAAALLGTNALPLLPDLIRTWQDPGGFSKLGFREVFANLGPPAIPALAEAIRSAPRPPAHLEEAHIILFAWTDIQRREGLPDHLLPTILECLRLTLSPGRPETAVAAAGLAGCLGSRSEPMIPLLITQSDQAIASIRVASVMALGLIGRSPATVVPELASRLSDSDREVRQEALKALARFTTNAAPAVPAMARLVQDPASSVALTALTALASLGPLAAPAAPQIMAALDHGEVSVQARAAAVLVKVERDPSLVLPALTRALAREELDIRVNAARSLGTLGQNAAAAVESLIATLSDIREPVQISVVETLGNIGPPAQAAVPDLYLAWNNNQSALGPYVKTALVKIHPEAGGHDDFHGW